MRRYSVTLVFALTLIVQTVGVPSRAYTADVSGALECIQSIVQEMRALGTGPIDDFAEQWLDTDYMARAAYGRDWKRLAPGERQRLMDELLLELKADIIPSLLKENIGSLTDIRVDIAKSFVSVSGYNDGVPINVNLAVSECRLLNASANLGAVGQYSIVENIRDRWRLLR